MARTKRKRFQRRNSKTPAMLNAMNLPCQGDIEREMSIATKSLAVTSQEQLDSGKNTHIRTGTKEQCRFDSWDRGLDIVEDIVTHIRQRRKYSHCNKYI
jgi:hypothetical protein